MAPDDVSRATVDTGPAQPHADAEANLRDFDVDLPPLLGAGRAMLQVTNVDSEDHQWNSTRLVDGTARAERASCYDSP